MNCNCSNWNEMEWEVVREGVRRKAFTGEGATVAVNELMPGHAPRPHAHIHEQIVYIMEGECDFHVEDKVYHLTPGGMLVVPPNVTHYAQVTSDCPVINLDIFTPKRPEYVK